MQNVVEIELVPLSVRQLFLGWRITADISFPGNLGYILEPLRLVYPNSTVFEALLQNHGFTITYETERRVANRFLIHNVKLTKTSAIVGDIPKLF